MLQRSEQYADTALNEAGAVVVDLASRLAPRPVAPRRDESRRYLAANDVGLFPESAVFGKPLQTSAALVQAFSRYLPSHLVESLVASPEQADQGLEARDMTVLFADIRGFTGMSEVLKDDPMRVAHLAKTVLGALAEIVVAHGGVIDKFVGDGIMAYWGAPNADARHAARAVAAAEAMLVAVEALDAQLDLSLPDGGRLPPVRIGVGVNSGACVVGNLGSAHRLNYSVIGDAVNVASRLVGMTKDYGVYLLVGEGTVERMAPCARRREVGRTAVRGRTGVQGLFTFSPVAPAANDAAIVWPAIPPRGSMH
ncbi:MAG: adenylate/guanylate cyclase domain-containing protein [Proteobacteria bacterium]|nr:adenylate/guanylate cyclase domain-containing protein [Pseudomonadota bacterium]